jgi:dTDP-4-dehydrorhamnose 3,5-epimerase
MPGDPNPRGVPRKTRIDGVLVQELSWYSDLRGSLSVLLRNDQAALRGESFGQAYVTTLLPGVVKAWHRHREQTDRMVGLVGRSLLVLVDGRPGSPTHGALESHMLGDRHPAMVLIPPGVWHGLANASGTEVVPIETLVLNLPDRAYSAGDPDEERTEPHAPPAPGLPRFDWARRDG